jgi:hypothetical protein
MGYEERSELLIAKLLGCYLGSVWGWKPWEKAKGAVTAWGKVSSSMTALQHGMRLTEFRLMEALVAAYTRMER